MVWARASLLGSAGHLEGGWGRPAGVCTWLLPLVSGSCQAQSTLRGSGVTRLLHSLQLIWLTLSFFSCTSELWDGPGRVEKPE